MRTTLLACGLWLALVQTVIANDGKHSGTKSLQRSDSTSRSSSERGLSQHVKSKENSCSPTMQEDCTNPGHHDSQKQCSAEEARKAKKLLEENPEKMRQVKKLLEEDPALRAKVSKQCAGQDQHALSHERSLDRRAFSPRQDEALVTFGIAFGITSLCVICSMYAYIIIRECCCREYGYCRRGYQSLRARLGANPRHPAQSRPDIEMTRSPPRQDHMPAILDILSSHRRNLYHRLGRDSMAPAGPEPNTAEDSTIPLKPGKTGQSIAEQLADHQHTRPESSNQVGTSSSSSNDMSMGYPVYPALNRGHLGDRVQQDQQRHSEHSGHSGQPGSAGPTASGDDNGVKTA